MLGLTLGVGSQVSHPRVCWSTYYMCSSRPLHLLWRTLRRLLLPRHVCMLWTPALAVIKGQAQRAAIICPCVEKREDSEGLQWGKVKNTLAEGFSFFKKSVTAISTEHIIQCADCLDGLRPVSVDVAQNGASSAGTQEAPQVWQRRWDICTQHRSTRMCHRGLHVLIRHVMLPMK